MRSILLEKIKLVSEDVNLSSIKSVCEQYTIHKYHVKKIKYTVNTSCFHRYIDVRTNSKGLSVKRLFVERIIVFTFDKSGEETCEHEKKVDEMVNAIIGFDKLNNCVPYEIGWL